MSPPIRYRIVPSDPAAHLFTVTCSIADPNPAGQVVRMPTWIPGSYLIREFARNVVSLHAESAGKPVPVAKIAKDAWRCEPCAEPLCLTYEVYAWDLSVRAAHLDEQHAYFNAPSVFIYAEGKAERACEVEIVPPEGERYRDWRVATSMRRADAQPYDFGRYAADNYDELADHPVEMSAFTLVQFEAGGARHDIAISGRHRCDTERLARDLRRLTQWHIDLFGNAPESKAPFDHYTFIVLVVGEGYGGLEHRASTTLLCARDTLPTPERTGVDDDYRTFLGLASHEYFHSWNVKRIKPAAFTPYDLTQENYTRLLWAFEGFTSYYDDLALVRSGLISMADYLEIVGKNISTVLRTNGRLKQSVAEASFDAWIKYYRPDENAPNALVSYYVKGSLVALALDLKLRRDSQVSLDEVMRALWIAHGQSGIGVPENGVQRIADCVSGLDLADFFARYVDGTEDLPLAELLACVGIDIHFRAAENQADKGGKPSKTENTIKPALGARITPGNEARLTHIYAGGAAHRAGLSAGDVVIAADGLRVTGNLETMLARRKPEGSMKIHAFRRDELMLFELPLLPAPSDICWLALADDAEQSTLARRASWLGQQA